MNDLWPMSIDAKLVASTRQMTNEFYYYIYYKLDPSVSIYVSSFISV